MTKSTKILASILLVLVIGLGVIIGVPSIRNTTADAIASWTSPKYAQSIEDNKKQAEEITSLKEEVKTKQNTIAEKDSLIATKDSQIKEKNDTIANYETQLDTCKNNIETLSTQKVLLCNSLTEIDNKINATTDSVELENLETKKSAILNQIDTLNSEIATLTEQKTQLETDIETLQQEKVTLQNEIAQLKTEKTTLQAEVADLQERLRLSEETAGVKFVNKFFTVTNNIEIDAYSEEWFYGIETIVNFDYFSNVADDWKDEATVIEYYVLSLSYDNIIDADTLFCHNSFIAERRWFHNGTRLSNNEIANLIKSYSENNKSQLNLKVKFSSDENQKYYFDCDIIDKIMSGKFINSDGDYVDFDNNVLFDASKDEIYTNGEFYLRYDARSNNSYTLFYEDYYGQVGPFAFIDENTILINAQTYYKEGTQPTEPETPTGVTADKILIKIKGSIDEHNYYLINFSESNGTLIKYYDTIIVDSNPLEFVNFDLESNILTFNNTKSGTQIVLSDVAYETIGNGYKIKSAIYDGISLVIFD